MEFWYIIKTFFDWIVQYRCFYWIQKKCMPSRKPSGNLSWTRGPAKLYKGRSIKDDLYKRLGTTFSCTFLTNHVFQKWWWYNFPNVYFYTFWKQSFETLKFHKWLFWTLKCDFRLLLLSIRIFDCSRII